MLTGKASAFCIQLKSASATGTRSSDSVGEWNETCGTSPGERKQGFLPRLSAYHATYLPNISDTPSYEGQISTPRKPLREHVKKPKLHAVEAVADREQDRNQPELINVHYKGTSRGNIPPKMSLIRGNILPNTFT